MKLLHVVSTYLPAVRYGGTIFVVHGLCKALVRRGHEVTVFTTSIDGATDSAVPHGRPVDIDGVRVVYFRSRVLRRLAFAPSLWLRARRELREYDLVHLHALFEWPVQAAARAARAADVPYLVAPHGMLVPELLRRRNYIAKRLWLRIERANLARAAGLHVTSALEERDLRRLALDLPRSHVVPYGIDLPGTVPRVVRAPSSPPTILFLGRLHWKKGLDRLIPALRYVVDARLIVAGNDEAGYEAELRGLAARCGLSERIEFRGPVYGPAKDALLASADVFALPSYSENFGNAVLEALAAGKPVVVTPEVGLASEVEQAGAGAVVSGEPEPFGAKLRELLSDPSRLREMGANAQRLVRQKFSWDGVGLRMEQVLQQILEERRSMSRAR